MKSNAKARRPIVRTVSFGLSLLLICIIICLIHIFDIRSEMQKNETKQLENQFDTVMEIFDDEIERQNAVTIELATKIMAYDEKDREEAASKEIAKYESILPKLRFAYVVSEDYKVYYADRVASALTIMENITSQKKNANHVICTQTEMWLMGKEKIPTITVIHPIRIDNVVVGYVLGSRSYVNEFKEVKYKQLLKNGDCFIVNRSGRIIGSNIASSELRNDSTDFFGRLYKNSNQSSNTRQTIIGLQSKLVVNSKGSVDFISADGREQRVIYQRMSGTDDAYFFMVYKPDLLLLSSKPVVFRSLIYCMMIIVFLIGMIAIVWATSKRSQQLIEELAFGDKVTGGKNVNYFQQHAMRIISSNSETPFLLYRFDILNFRYINEAYGHVRADKVLTACVQEFSKQFSARELCARINSDQFMALVVNDAMVSTRWQNFHNAVGEEARLAGVRYPIRFKIGIYQVRKGDSNIDVMIDHANVARKSLSGDEKILEATYSDNIIASMHKTDKIETDMQAALTNGEFRMFLQPKWDIYEDKIAGAEALVRWIRADGSMVYPNEFIPIFEKNGFIEKLDYYMLENVCRMLHELDSHPDTYNVYPVSVNQSRLLINNPDYVKNVEKIIKKYSTPINMLELEITETVFFSERNKMIDIMNQLKDLGLTLSMDDFGSGYSSLNVLKDIPFDILKIDREFFSESVTSESSIWIMAKIIEMAQGLGIHSICEGVEKEEQVDILKRIGCGMAQGFYYSKPIPMQEFIDKYCNKKRTQ